ncbi:MAG: hypothetical protein NTY38_19670 [Acidobacteria bacterium]|nr:hypothetical protein [Acidobacteriota bacterium]
MKRTRRLLLPLLFALGLYGEDQTVAKIFTIQYGDVNQIGVVLEVYPVKLKLSPAIRSIAVAGTPEAMKLVGEAIQKLDVSPVRRSIELVAYLISATRAGEQSVLPAELEPVAKQLRTLGYQGCALLDAIPVRTLEQSSGSALGKFGPANARTLYYIQFRSVVITQDRPAAFRIGQLSLKVGDSEIVTSLDLREGQKVVVGKTREGDQSVFLVLTARVVE